jgi:hypothetical protein
MGITAKIKEFKAPTRRLPGNALVFQRKLMDAHSELSILSKGPVTQGIKRLAANIRARLDREYAALAPAIQQLENSGIFFRYDGDFLETVAADILQKNQICGCPILFLCNPERIAIGSEKKQAYRAYYQVGNKETGAPEDIGIYASIYLEDARNSQEKRTDPELLGAAYWANCDLTELAPLIPDRVPERIKLALATSELMSAKRFGGSTEEEADQKIAESLIHELTHFFHSREAKGRLFPEGCTREEAAFTRLSYEMLAESAILLYSDSPHPNLGSLLAGQLFPKPRRESSAIISFFNMELFGCMPHDFQEILPQYLRLSAREIRGIARKLVDSVSETLFSKPWAEVATEHAYEEAKRIVLD